MDLFGHSHPFLLYDDRKYEKPEMLMALRNMKLAGIENARNLESRVNNPSAAKVYIAS